MAKRQIRAYEQSQDFRWIAGEVKPERIGIGATTRDHFAPTDTSNGICYGLSIWWIIKKAKQQDFWSWMTGPGPQVTEIKELFRSQRSKEGHDFDRFDAADQKVRTETGMARQNNVLMKDGTKFKYKGYYYISLRGAFPPYTSESGHAIAAYLNPGGISRYFDPNFGEYETDTMQETLAELGELVKAYHIRGPKIFWCCWN